MFDSWRHKSHNAIPTLEASLGQANLSVPTLSHQELVMSLSIWLSAINFKGVCYMNYAKQCTEEKRKDKKGGSKAVKKVTT